MDEDPPTLRQGGGKDVGGNHLPKPSRMTISPPFIEIPRPHTFALTTRKDHVLADVYGRICSLMAERQLYLRPDMDILMMSAEVGTNKTYVSQSVNRFSGMHFNTFINAWRINYAMHQLLQRGNVDISLVAHECGFTTITTFVRLFKFFSGMTPKEWVKAYGQMNINNMRH